ncbi:MAG: putative 4-hydroxybenzoate polyprenyltransferase [Thermodesulfovibrionales bacterium]|nr:putative 4-hydroxybenzoate polyprenyltransferase [Thermodesulfovibrionales bacterium]
MELADIKDKFTKYLKMIKFSHSVFALPFAFTAAILAAEGIPTIWQMFWIAIAMIGARSGAMGLNRVIDRKIDAANPRTKGREIPAGTVSVASALAFSFISLGIMVFSAYMLNPLCLRLSPVAIAVLVLYSFTKRFTWVSHFVLGLAISAAPLGAWIAVTGTFNWGIIPMVLAVLLWLPGFDILYALQDREFDRGYGLHSIPVSFGVERSLMIARALHLVSWLSLCLTGIIFSLGEAYWLGMLIVAVLFIYEHSLLKPHDLSKLDMAFFNMNGYISVTVFVFTFADILFF